MKKVEKEIYKFDKHQLVGKVDSNFFGKTDCEIESFQFRKICVCQLIKR